MDELFIKVWVECFIEEMMYYSVSYCGLMDVSGLGVGDVESCIIAVLVSFVF